MPVSQQINFGEAPAAAPSADDVTFLNQEAIESFTCGICYGPVIEARRTCSQDHFFCSKCLHGMEAFASPGEGESAERDMTCPTCRDPMLMGTDHKPGKRAPFVDNVVNLAWVTCNEVGCNTKCTFKDLPKHKLSCDHVIVRCLFHGLGCSHRCKRSEVGQHMKDAVGPHLRLQYDQNHDFLSDLKYNTTSIRRDIRSSYKQLGEFNGNHFEDVKHRQLRLEAKVDKMGEQMDSIGAALRHIVATQMKFAPAVVKGEKGSATIVEHVQGFGEQIRKRLTQHDAVSSGGSVTPLAKKQKSSPVAPGAPGPSNAAPYGSGQSASRALPPLPSDGLESVMRFKYSPTSPSYSPTSPSYSPTSPNYDLAGEELLDDRHNGGF